MRLVTYQAEGGQPRAGALFDGDTAILDLRAAAQATRQGDPNALASIQGLIEAGPAGLEVAQALLRKCPSSAVVPRAGVRLRAPIQPP